MPDPLAARLKLLRNALQQRAREQKEADPSEQPERPAGAGGPAGGPAGDARDDAALQAMACRAGSRSES